ncbi:MAG: LemA family protein [Candidatus Magasanikbacteria bacterium]|jgi:LemA protein|nr:LemA family protein [Candidatus Magasanikbacteria bacterium]MBT4314543.1 LemA family protein [Candidatus Magasanikbacteria bacterium]MBT4547441.1 LemA family protein [Candidatus Magasanikbacteria bacterium]
MTGLYILIGVVAVILLWLIGVFNALVRLKNRAKEAWSDIDVQLKRRHDLIPNLVSSVKGYMTHEKDLLENITKARSQAMDAQKGGNTGELANAENMLGGMLGKLQIAVEAYPDLKANQNVMQLMDELSDTENKIQASRRFYNGQVRDFNTKIQTFPNNMVAGMLRFTKFEFFEADESEKENIEVKL